MGVMRWKKGALPNRQEGKEGRREGGKEGGREGHLLLSTLMQAR